MTVFARAAHRFRSRINATPEWRAWRAACREARRRPRRTAGRIALAGYDLGYVDLLTLCPQWHDVFVRKTLDVTLPAEAPVIFDCGANVGIASLYFKRRYPRARIHAFEADDRIAAVLADNLQRNGAPDVEVTRAAVWTYTGTVAFRAEGADSGAIDSVAAATLPGLPHQVPCVRLRDLIAGEAIDLIKLDVEGAEGPLLRDCAGVLHNVGAMAIEVHEFDPAVRRLPEILGELTEAGFTWSLDECVSVPWLGAPRPSPFAAATVSFVVVVRAWRDSPHV